MLGRVRSMMQEQRTSSNLHTSERNPAYLKLMMMEQALQARLKEAQPYVSSDQDPRPAQPIVRGANAEAIKDKRAQRAGMTGTTMEPVAQPERSIVRGKGVAEGKKATKRKIREASELQQAQVVLASQDMVDKIQGMLEDVSEMQFKDLPALINQAKSEVGPANATQFQQAATEALTALLQALQQGKVAMEGAQAALTGQAPAVDAAPTGEMPGGEMPGGEEELPPPAEPAGKELGRSRR